VMIENSNRSHNEIHSLWGSGILPAGESTRLPVRSKAA
jgi:hypothetical protein